MKKICVKKTVVAHELRVSREDLIALIRENGYGVPDDVRVFLRVDETVHFGETYTIEEDIVLSWSDAHEENIR